MAGGNTKVAFQTRQLNSLFVFSRASRARTRAAAGKSHLADAITRLLPVEDLTGCFAHWVLYNLELRRRECAKANMFVGLTLLAMTGPARGEDKAPPAAETNPAPAATGLMGGKLIIGADTAFQLPLGNFADVTGVGFGGLVRVEYSLIPNLNGTFRVGYIYSLKKDTDGLKTSTDNIPLWVGTKYFLTDIIYGGAEVGLNLLWAKTEGTMAGLTQSQIALETKFGGTVGAGVLLGPLDVKAQLEILDFGHTNDSLALMINVGYK